MDLEPDTSGSSSRPLKRRSEAPSLLPLDGNEAKDDEIYGASHFGQFGEYMRRKRAKLQIQNAVLAQTEDSGIFRGLSIYINGWTDPSVQDLRELIVRNGGTYQPYLDKKSLVTHIITCSLTPAKLREFKYMKVVVPTWIVDSVKRGKLLPWQDYKYLQQNRTEVTQGEQRTLLSYNVRPGSSKTGAEESNSVQLNDSGPMQTSAIETDEDNGITTPIPYAAESSNPIAQRALADPNWRRAHTSAAPDFVEGYYRNSRLHYLSTWKAELRSLIVEAQEKAEKAQTAEVGEGSTAKESGLATSHAPDLSISSADLGTLHLPSKKSVQSAMVELASGTRTLYGVFNHARESTDDQMQRIIMHCDFDCFFVSVGLITRPHLRGKPVVVCHSQGAQGGASSTSEVASASYEAREQGVKNGMSLQQARKLCPAVMTMPYEFELYRKLSLQFYSILLQHADDVQAVSVDEALIDVTTAVTELGHKHCASSVSKPCDHDVAKALAENLRTQIREATGCEVSIGIGHNILLARLATRRAKPAGSVHVSSRADDIVEFLSPLDITDLPGFGHAAKNKALGRLGSSSVAKLREVSRDRLCEVFGRTNGETLWGFVRGIDHRQLERDGGRRSVSCEINYGIRFVDMDEAERFIHQVSREVKIRLDKIGMLGRSLTLKVLKRSPSAPIEPPKFLGHGKCDSFTKQTQLLGPGGQATNDDKIIAEHSMRLLRTFRFDPRELRGIGIQIQRLESNATKEQAESLIGGQTILPYTKASGSPSRLQSGATMAPPPEGDIAMADVSSENASLYEGKQAMAQELELPSFSQVDLDVYDALPDDVKQELDAEFKRRSTFKSPVSVLPNVDSPKKGQAVNRITRQLAPRTTRSSLSPKKSRLYQPTTSKASAPRVSEHELHSLDLDPDVFYLLPEEVQREQLVRARMLKKGAEDLVDMQTQKKTLKPRKPPSLPAEQRRQLSPPRAKFREPLILRQHSKQGERHSLTEPSEIQNAIGNWVEKYRHWAPKEKDVKFFAKHLIQCVDSATMGDDGIEKATAVMKWWMVLLKTYWGDYETIEGRVDHVGEAWWRAFKGVKEQLDLEVRKKFGGLISLT
ncbi:hypothetical protein F5887DRAFT_1277909 [Amanita rubescens]|nr:hypothetical protein F5887DRAFT_1277909 [Amanita rubescens]